MDRNKETVLKEQIAEIGNKLGITISLETPRHSCTSKRAWTAYVV
jgi:hypothetical protein